MQRFCGVWDPTARLDGIGVFAEPAVPVVLKVVDPGALPPTPRDLARFSQNGGPKPPERETGCRQRHPASVLGPGSALGLLPSIALSSAQVEWSVTEVRGVVETRVKGAIPLGIGPSDAVFSWYDKHKGRTQWDRMLSVPRFSGWRDTG